MYLGSYFHILRKLIWFGSLNASLTVIEVSDMRAPLMIGPVSLVRDCRVYGFCLGFEKIEMCSVKRASGE
jgi:hypothetical protein